MNRFKMNLKSRKGITLIALVITIVVLIILAGVLINISLGNNGIFNRAKTAKEQYQNAQDYEEGQIAKYSNEIDDYVSGNRSSTSRKDIIFNTSQSGTREINIEQNVNNWDFIIVYYRVAGNTSGSIVFDTTETSTYTPAYCYYSDYCFGIITLNTETNKVTMTVKGSSSDWNQTTYSYLTKAIGVKL